MTAGLSLNNVPDLAAAIRAVRRVLVSGGHLVFTVPHPCFEAPQARWSGGADEPPGRVVGNYLVEGFWRSANPDGARRAGNQHRMLSTYVTSLVEHGLVIGRLAEPAPDARVIAEQPQRAGLPPFLLISGLRSPTTGASTSRGRAQHLRRRRHPSRTGLRSHPADP
ncbi:class I SAM-dependent methyltransferase (plasmid) [Streptomyces canus]